MSSRVKRTYLQNATESFYNKDQHETESSEKYANPSGINRAFTRRQIHLKEPTQDILAGNRR